MWYNMFVEKYLDEAFSLHQHKSPSVIRHNYQGALFVGLMLSRELLSVYDARATKQNKLELS